MIAVQEQQFLELYSTFTALIHIISSEAVLLQN